MTPREVLEAVKLRIAADATSYDQNTYCGTVCCIAGHIDIVVNGETAHLARSNYNNDNGNSSLEVQEAAMIALGETGVPWLFLALNWAAVSDYFKEDSLLWPLDLSREYVAAGNNAPARVTVGIKAIDRYIAERGL